MKVFDGDASCLALAPSGDSEKSYAKMNDYFSEIVYIDIIYSLRYIETIRNVKT